MIFNIFFMISLIQLDTVLSDNSINDYYDIYEQDSSYRGEKFPKKYLSIDGVQPTFKDFSYYVKTISRIVHYFAQLPNETDPNVAIGAFLTKAVLKRTLLDYDHKMGEENKNIIKSMVLKLEYIDSHYIYNNYVYGPKDLAYQLSRLLTYDDSLVYSIGEFNKYVMKKWINSNIKIHDFIQIMDNITLPREKYAEIVIKMDDYYWVSDSDECIASMSSHSIPLRKDAEINRCRLDDQAKYCKDRVMTTPSVAYALSHRYIYLMGLQLIRRCYVVSEEADKMHMDIMCANMYRETVYLARRGYFYKDLFLEHITLCALLGYEEFHRYNWFQKSASWVDENGCVAENRNFEMNRTLLYLKTVKTPNEIKQMKKMRKLTLEDDCHHHQMVLAMNVLAHAIRNAAHFMETMFA